MKRVHIIIGIVIAVLLVIAIVVGFGLWFLFGGFLPSPPKPEITHGEFPFRLVYEINGETKGAWDRLPREWTDNPAFYNPQDWIKTPLMQSGNVERKYQKVCKGVDKLLAEHGYVHNGNVFEVQNSNHDTIVLFCHFGVECVILSHIFGCSPMVLWHNFVALPTSVTTLITEEREQGIAVFRTQQFGDISHLYAGGEEPAFAARFCECYDDDTRH